jgi:hypothetical protein
MWQRELTAPTLVFSIPDPTVGSFGNYASSRSRSTAPTPSGVISNNGFESEVPGSKGASCQLGTVDELVSSNALSAEGSGFGHSRSTGTGATVAREALPPSVTTASFPGLGPLTVTSRAIGAGTNSPLRCRCRRSNWFRS